MQLGLVQQRASDDPAQNLKRASEAVRAAAERGAQVVCLQELFRTTYFPQTQEAGLFDWAEPVPGPSSEAFSSLATELGIVIVAPVFERRTAGVYHNSALAFGPDGALLQHYRKAHIPHDPGFHEKYFFAPGDAEPRAFDTPFGRIGVLICWDQWFPEAARLLALDGAELIVYPTAIGTLPHEDAAVRAEQLEAWQISQRAHAIANGVFVAAVNRVGIEGSIDFWGSSFVCDPGGRLLEVASQHDEDTRVVECELDRIEAQRREWPFLRDRRVDLYESLTRRTRED